MKLEKSMIAGTVVGAGTLGAFIGMYGEMNDWSPADRLLQEVDACAPYLPDTATHVDELPEGCFAFRDELDRPYQPGYILPAKKDFVAEYTPSTLYDTRLYAIATLMGSFVGVTTGGATWAAVEGAKSRENSKRERDSRFAGNVVLRRRILKNSNGYVDGLPLDCEINRTALEYRVNQIKEINF